MDRHLDTSVLDAYLEGALAPGERQAVDDHMLTCRPCYTLYQERAELEYQRKAAVTPATSPIAPPSPKMTRALRFTGVAVALLLLLAAAWWLASRIG